MDLLAHMVYGATVCSRSGIAGGRRGREGRWFRDRTVWWAAVFGVLPDVVSMGWPFLLFVLEGTPGNFFRDLDPRWLEPYRYAHSLLIALGGVFLLRLLRRNLFVPALAWPLHVVLDAATHGTGKFHAPLFHPLSAWGFEGIPWWRHPEVVWIYWSVPVAIWVVLRLMRNRNLDTDRQRSGRTDP